MSNFDWKETLAKVAPMIATALGGPLAGAAVKVAATALGVEPSEEALADAVASGDPQVLLKLKEADNTFRLEMRRLDIKESELDVKDRASARRRDVESGDHMTAILAGVITSGFLFMVWYVLTGQAKIESALAGTLIGYVSAKAEQVVTYYFGSSRGSKTKDAAMARALVK